MPRLLPWLAKEDTREPRHRNTSTPTPSGQPSSRPRPRTPSPERGAASSRAGDDQGKKRRTGRNDDTPSKGVDFLRSSRSPPTSPIASPPTEEYIIPGFENDDMYIMVEDEFYTVAQQFTRHLHHAEYVRRKEQAKKMNASVLRNIERPTDGTTSMSRATLKRKESERLHARQRKGLEPTVRRPDDNDDLDDEEQADLEDEEEEREDDPWYGTSLHTFMTSPRKNRSLVGLERIRSKTRAAAGFASEVALASARRRSSSRPLSREDLSLRADAHARVASDELARSSEEDDDLEIVETRSLPQSRVFVRASTVKRESPEVDLKPVVRETTVKRREAAYHDRVSTSSPPRQRQSALKRENVGFRRNPLFKSLKEASTSSTRSSTSTSTARKKPESEPKKEASTEVARPNMPRKRRFLDDLDDFDITPKIENDDVSRNKYIIQDQPSKVLSTASTAKESRSTYRTASGSRQQETTTKKSRIADIPTFLV